MVAYGYGLAFSADEDILELTMAMVARICDYVKNH